MSDFDSLKRGYRQRLIVQLDALLAIRGGLQADDTDRDEVMGSLRRLAHSLRGTAGSYGYKDVSAAAAAVEEARESDLFVLLDELLGEIRRTVARPDSDRTTLLVIDDDPSVRSLVALTAGQYVRRVLQASTASKAREYLGSSRIGIIVLDLMLPDTDGRTLLMEIKKDPLLSRIPVVVMTGKLAPHIRAECLALGAHEVHDKPVDPVVLSTCIAALSGFEGRSSLQLLGDPVTGLLDAGMFRETCEAARRGYEERGEPWCALLVELAGYDILVRDRGVQAAQAALRVVADGIREVFTDPTDVLCRWKDGTFAVVMSDTRAAEATGRGRAIVSRLNGSRVSSGDEIFHIRVVAGGVEAGRSDVGPALAVARRMLELSRAAMSDDVVIGSTVQSKRGKQILVVEDDPDMARLIRGSLPDAQVTIRGTGEDGLAWLSGPEKVHLVVLDIGLPGMDGLEVLRRIRKSPRRSGVPVLLLTALGTDRHVVEGFDAGADDYIVKPFARPILQARVRNLLARRRT